MSNILHITNAKYWYCLALKIEVSNTSNCADRIVSLLLNI